MPVLDTTQLAASIGLGLLWRAAQEDDAYREGACCPHCHGADLEDLAGERGMRARWNCRTCGMDLQSGDLADASHLADALKCYAEPLRKIEHHDLRAAIEHAALLEMQLAQLRETLAAERAAIHNLAERVRSDSTRLAA